MSLETNRSGARRRLLTAAEEVLLARRIERGDLAAKQEMIERNLGLVYALAKRYRGRGVPFEDLVQEGTLGLARAVEQFDPRRGAKFSTYAVWWIRRSLANAIRDGRTIRIPAHASDRLAAIQRAEHELGRSVPGPASAEAIAERTGFSVRRVRALREAASVTASLDEQVGQDGAPLGELIADRDAVDPWRHADERETHRQVWSMLGTLPARHREVLLRRYGLHGDSPETHAQIGARLGVGEERSRQLEREALHRLRSMGADRRLAA
jgi:RNA polymerase primary sigma factor